MTWIGACLVAAFLLGALLGSVFSRQREDAKRDQSHADKLDYPSDANQETSIAALARSHIAFAKDYYSTRERDTAHSRKTYKVSFWTAVGVGTYTVFTFIIVIFSVVQYGENHRFNKRQLRFFNDQVGVMRGQLDEMRSDRRPWVSVNQFIGDITWDKDGFHIAVRTNIENTGKSPAFGVLLQQELFPIMGTPEINGPSARVRQISAEQRQRNKNTPIGFPVFPGKTEVSVGLETYSRDKIAALNAYIKKCLEVLEKRSQASRQLKKSRSCQLF
jgi:hypothetical protein